MEADLAPFRKLAGRARIGMTAHILYSAWDQERPATLSPTIIADVIRGAIGFDGLLLSDDLEMAALAGSFGERAQRALAAGCDLVLHGSGRLEESREVAEAVPEIGDAAAARLARAIPAPGPERSDLGALLEKRDALLLHGCDGSSAGLS
jgi:beta-N-acetylhexosaminidase